MLGCNPVGSPHSPSPYAQMAPRSVVVASVSTYLSSYLPCVHAKDHVYIRYAMLISAVGSRVVCILSQVEGEVLQLVFKIGLI